MFAIRSNVVRIAASIVLPHFFLALHVLSMACCLPCSKLSVVAFLEGVEQIGSRVYLAIVFNILISLELNC